MSPMGYMIWKKSVMHGWYKANNILIWHTRSHFLSPSMLVAHVNGRCVETCANIKLFFLHVPISLKYISFNIVGHGMDLIVKVLPPCYEPYLFAHLWQWIWWSSRGQWRSFLRTMGCWYVQAYDTKWNLPMWKKKRSQNKHHDWVFSLLPRVQ
jgi:hypothetical protein